MRLSGSGQRLSDRKSPQQNSFEPFSKTDWTRLSCFSCIDTDIERRHTTSTLSPTTTTLHFYPVVQGSFVYLIRENWDINKLRSRLIQEFELRRGIPEEFPEISCYGVSTGTSTVNRSWFLILTNLPAFIFKTEDCAWNIYKKAYWKFNYASRMHDKFLNVKEKIVGILVMSLNRWC